MNRRRLLCAALFPLSLSTASNAALPVFAGSSQADAISEFPILIPYYTPRTFVVGAFAVGRRLYDTFHGPNLDQRFTINGSSTFGVVGTPSAGNASLASSSVLWMNVSGTATGIVTKFDSSGQLASYVSVRWNANGTIDQLSRAGSTSTKTIQVLGINRAGTMVGYDFTTSTDMPLIWQAGAIEATLLPGTGAASAMTDSGIIGGTASDVSKTPQRWASPSAFPVKSTGDSWTPTGMNGVGTMTGYSSGSVCRWKVGAAGPETLASLQTASDDHPYAINDAGTIVGTAKDSGGVRAVRWNATGTAITRLGTFGTPPNATYDSYAFDINESGYTVGVAPDFTVGFARRAMLWGPDNVAKRLNDVIGLGNGWTDFVNASGISDVGFISGIGMFDPDGTGPQSSYLRYFLALVPSLGTYGRGDANFDTKTDFDDLVILAQHYGESNPTQKVNVGDFNLNGVVDFNDLVVVAQNYGAGTTSLSLDASFAEDWALAQSLVPEPASLALIGLAGLALRRARR